MDSTIADIARKHAGVLTKTVVAYKAKESLERAEKALQKFVLHGEARSLICGV
jgi:hypothetical protein